MSAASVCGHGQGGRQGRAWTEWPRVRCSGHFPRMPVPFRKPKQPGSWPGEAAGPQGQLRANQAPWVEDRGEGYPVTTGLAGLCLPRHPDLIASTHLTTLLCLGPCCPPKRNAFPWPCYSFRDTLESHLFQEDFHDCSGCWSPGPGEASESPCPLRPPFPPQRPEPSVTALHPTPH